ncbi:MAG: SDR family oxidoreductase [Clostridiales bacterium]|nr:SDR family oxidoreductase [Clostridiales bacterium]
MKKVLITGGATGIGKATALLFKEKGYDVYITYHKTAPDFNGITATQCDLSSIADIENLFNEVSDIDVLVNNAGVSLIKMINDVTAEDYESVMNVNERAVYFCSKFAAMQMIKKHSGSIINVSSMWGEVGASCETLYSMSKAGVIGLTKALAKELAPSGVTVNCVSPGIIDTRMNAMFSKEELAEEVPLERLGSAEEVASAILFLAENGYITGQNLSVNGGTVI